MSTDQAEAAAPAVDEAPAVETKTAPARDVDDFLADLDDVLNEATAAPKFPAPAAEPVPEPDAVAAVPDVDPDLDVEPPAAAVTVPDVEPVPEPDAVAAVPDVDPDLDAEPPAAAVTVPDVAPVSEPPASAPARDWWDPLYKHDTADQDTFTGNVPPTVTVPAEPPVTGETPEPNRAADVPGNPDTADKGDDEDSDEDGADAAPAKSKRFRPLRKRDQGNDADQDDEDGDNAAPAKARKKNSGKKDDGAKKAGAAVVFASEGLLNNPRGRQVLFAGTAYAMGWSLGLDDWATGLMEHSAQYATPVAGCALGAGVLGLATRTKVGGVVLVSSLALIAALEMVDPARIVGGGLALGLQIAYRIVRGWAGRYGEQWPWKGVVWAAHVPAATATVAFLLYGTN
ncbi:hypothetical protein [Streptomyces scopuliridis]|uniref:hypothetical protein n=1 Tax=Streptomyces scopuliridis TaxID=452529 RepID=UPI0036C4632A